MSHPLFEQLPLRPVGSKNFDELILTADSTLKCVFFWGENCPNCDIAKRNLLENLKEVQGRSLQWYEVNVYNDFDLGTRFGLHGIPVFIFFRGGKNLGRITSFPGMDPFLAAIDKLVGSSS